MKYAVVTGGTSGIGLGVAKMLIKKGYYVISTCVRNKDNIKIENFEYFYCDQSKRDDVYKFTNYVKAKIPHLDCLICNAGVTIRKPFLEFSDKDWDTMMDVALTSHYIMVREFYSIIPPGSRIIFTGSQMGIEPHATIAAYGVAKSAVHALAKNLVKIFEGTNTTVNVIVPGFVDTPWQKEKPENIRKSICNKTAIHRFAFIEEIVQGYEFCIDNPFVNGSLIEINGGYNFA